MYKFVHGFMIEQEFTSNEKGGGFKIKI